MKFINLNPNLVQQLISYNKTQIKELDTQRIYLEHLVQLYWNSSDKMYPYGILSSTSFNCLNRAKSDLIGVKKTLKMLAEFQYQLKSVR